MVTTRKGKAKKKDVVIIITRRVGGPCRGNDYPYGSIAVTRSDVYELLFSTTGNNKSSAYTRVGFTPSRVNEEIVDGS